MKDNLAEIILEAIRKAEEERVRLGVGIAENIERLKELGIYDKKEEKRYLFISCAGSGYQDKIKEFFKNGYYNECEDYYDHLQVVGSVLPLVTYELNNYCVVNSFSSDYQMFITLYNSLISQIYYLISRHKLNKVVVVREPVCDFYKDLLSFVNVNKNAKGVINESFPSQKEVFFIAIGALENFLSSEFGRGKIDLEVWYMFLENEQTFFEKVFHGKASSR